MQCDRGPVAEWRPVQPTIGLNYLSTSFSQIGWNWVERICGVMLWNEASRLILWIRKRVNLSYKPSRSTTCHIRTVLSKLEFTNSISKRQRWTTRNTYAKWRNYKIIWRIALPFKNLSVQLSDLDRIQNLDRVMYTRQLKQIWFSNHC